MYIVRVLAPKSYSITSENKKTNKFKSYASRYL